MTIPFALLFSFICLDWRHIPANLLSIGAIDFGIIVDGAVVMVENIFRELAERHGQNYNLIEVIRAAAHDVERPIFYADCGDHRGVSADLRLTGLRDGCSSPWPTRCRSRCSAPCCAP